MTKSDSIKELAAALNKAQSEMKGAKKDSNNPFFKSKYADLESVWEAARIPVTSNGLAVAQLPGKDELGDYVETMLMHVSGEFISDRLHFTPVESKPQAVGSAITYARRYGLQSILGICPEDDDGEGAMGRSIANTGYSDRAVDQRQQQRETAAVQARSKQQPQTPGTPSIVPGWREVVCHLGKKGGPVVGRKLGTLDISMLKTIKEVITKMANPTKEDSHLLDAVQTAIKELVPEVSAKETLLKKFNDLALDTKEIILRRLADEYWVIAPLEEIGEKEAEKIVASWTTLLDSASEK